MARVERWFLLTSGLSRPDGTRVEAGAVVPESELPGDALDWLAADGTVIETVRPEPPVPLEEGA